MVRLSQVKNEKYPLTWQGYFIAYNYKREKKIRGRKNQGENKSEGDQIFF